MPEPFRISVETAGPDCAAKGFPDQLGMRMAVALSSRGRRPDTAPAMRLTTQAQWERRAPYPGRGQNRRQGRRCPRRLRAVSAKTAPSNRGSKADLAFGGGRRGYVPRPFPKTLLVSRSYEGRNETHRPLMSLGCARLKPNPVGQQRLRSTIFPFGPPKKLKAKKRFLRKGGPNSSRNKIASLRRPPLTLRPFASLRVQAARAGLLSAAPRDTSWRWASGPRRKTRRIFDNGHEPLQVRPQARNPHPRHLPDRRPAQPPPGRRGKRRPGLRPHRPRIRSHPRPALDHSQAHGRGLRRLPQRQGDRHALPAHRRGPRLLRSRGRPLLLRQGHSGPRRHRPRRRWRRRRTRGSTRARKQGSADPRVRSRHGNASLRPPRRGPRRDRRLQGPHRRRLESIRGRRRRRGREEGRHRPDGLLRRLTPPRGGGPNGLRSPSLPAPDDAYAGAGRSRVTELSSSTKSSDASNKSRQSNSLNVAGGTAASWQNAPAPSNRVVQFGLFVVKPTSRHISTVFPSAVRTIVGSIQQRSTASSTACRAALSFALQHCIVAPPAMNNATAATATQAASRHAYRRCRGGS